MSVLRRRYSKLLRVVQTCSSEPNSMGSDKVDIAIIGCGPGGLATVNGLLQAVKNIKIKVYDSTPEFKMCGAGLAVASNGQAALSAINPDLTAQLRAEGRAMAPGISFNAEGQEMAGPGASAPPPRDPRTAPVTTGWFELQQLLLHALPSGVVQLGSSFVGYEETAEGVEVKFQDGSSVTAGLLIGADGYFSRVREQCLQDGPPDFGGTVIWRARRQWAPGCASKERSCFYQSAGGLALTFPIVGDHIVWTLSAPMQSLEAAGVPFTPRGSTAGRAGSDHGGSRDLWSSGKAKLERCLKVVGEHYSEELLHTMKTTDPSAVLEHGTYVRTPEALPEQGWGRGRVSLIGDAAHPLRPTGQGANQALEDAAELAWHVQEHGVTAEALRAYEASRLERVRSIVAQEQASGLGSYSKPVEGQPSGERPKTFSSPQEYSDFVRNKSFHRLVPQPMKQRRPAAARAVAAAPSRPSACVKQRRPAAARALAAASSRPIASIRL